MSAQIKVASRNDGFQEVFCKFTNDTLLFHKGEMISNTLFVKNNSKDSIKFIVDLVYPSEWKSLLSNEKLFTVPSGDSIFIPVRFLPNAIIKGSTRYFLSAFLINTKEKNIAYTYFFAYTKKKVKWELTFHPGNRLYFLNKENTISFSTNIINLGNEDQDIIMQLKNFSFNTRILDTNEKEIKKPVYSFRLNSMQDTSRFFKFQYLKRPENSRRIDLDYYNPFSLDEGKKYSLIVKSNDPATNPLSYGNSIGKKIEFVKLTDNVKVNDWGGAVIPLIIDANAYNLLHENPMLSLDLRGNTFIGKGRLNYSSLLVYSKNYYSGEVILNSPFNISYYRDKMSAGITGTGALLGLYGSYYFNRNNSINAFYSLGPHLSNIDFQTIGVNHFFLYPFKKNIIKSVSLRSGFFTGIYTPEPMNMQRLYLSPSVNIYKVNFGLTFTGQRSYFKQNDSTKITPSIGVNGSYYDEFFNKQFKVNVNGLYHSSQLISNNYNVGYTNFYRPQNRYLPSYRANSKLEYSFTKNKNIDLSSIVIANPIYYNTAISRYTKSFHNQLKYNVNINNTNFAAGLFYNYNIISSFESHSRGIVLNSNRFDFGTFTRAYLNVNFGYNWAPDLGSKNYFFLSQSMLAQYKTFTFQMYYHLGNTFLGPNTNNLVSRYPQLLNLSARYQYTFPIPNFVLELRNSYTYSTISGHSFVFVPELYYFTRNGWRFRISPEYFTSFRTDLNTANSYYVPGQNEVQDVKSRFLQSFNLGVGIRKEFGIPIPFMKTKFCSPEFLVYMDLNGNLQYDKGEQLLENVVINVNEFELISNEKGTVNIKNIEMGNKRLIVYSLVDLEGWFPNITDSVFLVSDQIVYIPFSKGIKIYGGVMVEREQYGATVDAPLNLSKIKITANNGKVFTSLTDNKGNYEMYLPYGNYTLTFDESILGDRFRLVENNYELTIDKNIDNLYIPFYIVEKKRKINIKKFDTKGNEKSDVDSPDLKKKKEEEERLKKEEELKNKKMTPAEKKKQEELEKKKKLEEEKKKKAELEKQKKIDEEKRKQDELDKKNKAKSDSLKNSSDNKELKKNKDGVIDLTDKGEVTNDDIKDLTNAILDKINYKNTKTDSEKSDKKDTKKDSKKDNKKDNKKDPKNDESVKKDVSSLKDLDRKINKDDFLDIEIEGLMYRVQVAASNSEVPTSWLKNQFNIKSDVYLFKNDDGMYNYCMGDFTTKGEAIKFNEKLAIQKRVNSFISYYYNNKRVPYKIIEQIYQSIIDQINEEKSNNSQNEILQKQQNDSVKQLMQDTIKLMKDTLNK